MALLLSDFTIRDANSLPELQAIMLRAPRSPFLLDTLSLLNLSSLFKINGLVFGEMFSNNFSHLPMDPSVAYN